MPVTFGYNQVIWFKETTTAYANVETMSTGALYPLLVKGNPTVKLDIETLETEHMKASGGAQVEEFQNGAHSVSISFEFTLPACISNAATANTIAILLKHTIGEVTTATNVKTYTFNELQYIGLSMAYNVGGASFVCHGLQISTWQFRTTAGGKVECVINAIASVQQQLALVSPPAITLIAAHPYYLFHHGICEYDDAPIGISGIDFTIDRMLEADAEKSYDLGSVNRARLVSGGFAVTGTIRRRYVQDGGASLLSKFLDEYLAGTYAKLEWLINHLTLSADYNLAFTFHQCRISDAGPKAADRGSIPEEIAFTAMDLDSASSNIVLEDGLTTPPTSTGAYSG